MTFSAPYPKISLDTIISSMFFTVRTETPRRKRGNQSRDVMRLLLSMMYLPCGGNLLRGSIQVSQAALAKRLALSRQWTSELIGRLCDEGWLRISAPHLPDGTQAIGIYRIGPRLQELIIKLMAFRQQRKNRVNDSWQKPPSKEEVQKNLQFLRDLQKELAEKLGRGKEKRW